MARKRGGSAGKAGHEAESAPPVVAEASPAPKRRGRPKSAEGPRGNAISLRGSVEWRAWVDRLANHDRGSVADVIDRALAEYGPRHGFAEPAPRR